MDSEKYIDDTSVSWRQNQTRTITRQCEETGEDFQLTQTLWGNTWFPDIRYCDAVLERKEQEEEDARKALLKKRMQESAEAWMEENVPPIYREELDRSYPINWKAHDKAMQVDGSIILIGNTRKGKTRTAMELLKRYALAGERPIFKTAEAMAGALGEAMSKTRMAHNGLIHQYSKVKILIVDDLGKENMSKRVQSDMFEIFNARFEHKLKTIITTNWVGDALIERYPDKELAKPLIARFREFCEPIRF